MIDVAAILPTTGRRPGFLRRALASVLGQSLKPRQIIVVVDAAETCIPEVIAQLDGIACEVIATGDTRGAGFARNCGARSARAYHLCFLDDDDVWKPSYLAAAFADGADFDLALTAFEKHNRDGARPEKVPPEELDAADFLVANPGLRGSNLIVTRELFWAAGGFSERLPSFNDMDFGLRLVAARPRRYRRIPMPLVEYHAHDGERLSRRGASTIPAGLEGFLQEHGLKMDHRQEAAFRARALDLWGVDPWAQEALERRLSSAMNEGSIAAHFPGLLHAAETTLLEATFRSDAEADERQAFIERLCVAVERREGMARLRSLRIVVITTDTPGSIERLLASLQRALDRTHWRAGEEGALIEMLFIRNDRDAEVDEQHDATIRTWSDRRIALAEVSVPRRSRPLSLTEARVFAFRAARARGWEPSPEAPVWFLDEDFCFEVLLPSVRYGYRRAAGGALLHRLEALATRHGPRGLDALVGGNSGAAPVPALGTIRRQALDLAISTSSDKKGAAWAVTLSKLLRRRDPYYDLTTDRSDEVLVPIRNAWWRASDEWVWDEIVERLELGLPVTRPALPSLGDEPPTAWGSLDAANVTGGNTVILSPRALRPDAFAQIRWGSVRSRRGDTTWSINCQKSGMRVARISLPLLHDRAPRRGLSALEAAARDALADAMGVGLYETLMELDRINCREVEYRANRRLADVAQNLASTADWMDSAGNSLPPAPRARLLRFLRDAHGALSACCFAGLEIVERLASDLDEGSI